LMFVFNLVFGDTDERDFEPLTVAISAEPDQPDANILVEILSEMDTEGLDLTVVQVDQATGPKMVEDGDAGLALVLPDGFNPFDGSDEAWTVDVRRGEDVGVEADVVLSIVDGIFEQFAATMVPTAAARAEGIDVTQLGPSTSPMYEIRQGQADDQQLS